MTIMYTRSSNINLMYSKFGIEILPFCAHIESIMIFKINIYSIENSEIITKNNLVCQVKIYIIQKTNYVLMTSGE